MSSSLPPHLRSLSFPSPPPSTSLPSTPTRPDLPTSNARLPNPQAPSSRPPLPSLPSRSPHRSQPHDLSTSSEDEQGTKREEPVTTSKTSQTHPPPPPPLALLRPELSKKPSEEESEEGSYGSMTTNEHEGELGGEEAVGGGGGGGEVRLLLSPPPLMVESRGTTGREGSGDKRGVSQDQGIGEGTTPPPPPPPPRVDAGNEGRNRLRSLPSNNSLLPSLTPPSTPFPTSSTSSSSKRIDPLFPSSLVPRAPSTTMYWSKTPVSGRIPRGMRAHTAVLVGNEIWCFGGCDRSGHCFREVWKLDCDTFVWSKPRVGGDVPPVTRAHTCTVVGDRLFVFGGGDGPNYYNETYYLDTLSMMWTKPKILGTPPSRRRAQTAVLYETKILIFGGGNGSQALNDVHALDISDLDRIEWTQLRVGGNVPLGRGYHSASIVGNKCLIFGGSDGSECFSDISILDLEILEWIPIPVEEESLIIPRLSHTCTPVGSYLFVIGGHDGVHFSNQVLLFNLVSLSWELRTPSGLPPSPRGYHQTILHDSRLFILGGFNGQTTFDEVWTLDLGGSAFLPLITQFIVEVPSSSSSD